MENIDMTTLVNDVCRGFWDARIFIDGRDPWDSMSLPEQNAIKEAALPFIWRTVPLVLESAKQKALGLVEQARESEFTDAETLTMLLVSDFGMANG